MCICAYVQMWYAAQYRHTHMRVNIYTRTRCLIRIRIRIGIGSFIRIRMGVCAGAYCMSEHTCMTGDAAYECQCKRRARAFRGRMWGRAHMRSPWCCIAVPS